MRFLIVAFCLASLGCSSLGAKYDEVRAKDVKRVAILALEIQQQQPKDSLGVFKVQEFKNGRPGDSKELKAMAKDIYAEFSAELTKKTGWKVVPYKEVIANAPYADLVKTKMEGMRATSMTDGHSEIIFPDAMLDSFAFRKLSPQEKMAMAKKMGANAYAELILYQSIDQGWSVGNLSGNARFAFSTRSNLTVFAGDTDEPVWRQQNVDGEVSRKSDELDDSTPRMQKIALIGKESAKSSLEKLVGMYPMRLKEM
jgi:hypothetical protein